MDLYARALKRFRSDKRNYSQLSRDMNLPWSTVRDIKKGLRKSPRVETIRHIAAHYGITA